jgi:hypothetical protein
MSAVPGILFDRRVLVVHSGTDDDTASGRATAALLRDLRDRGVVVVDAVSKPKHKSRPTPFYRR